MILLQPIEKILYGGDSMRIRKIFISIFLSLFWIFCFLLQHILLIADPFDSNLWYFYPMVAVSGLIQLLLLYLFKKQKHPSDSYIIYLALYCASCLGSLGLLLFFPLPNYWPLFCLSILIDFTGVFFSYRLLCKPKKDS